MRRLFILLLALLLPLQFTWAAAAVYCGHEGSTVAASVVAPAHHFGHHEHVHQDAKKDASKALSIDTDCGVCHAGSSPVIGASLQLQPLPPLARSVTAAPAAAHASAFARAPDRPQWRVLA
jgi:cytochrome c553